MLLFLSSLASAAPDPQSVPAGPRDSRTLPFVGRVVDDEVFEAELREPIGPVFDADRFDELLELASGARPSGTHVVRLVGRDAITGELVRVLDRLPVLPDVPEKEPFTSAPADNPGLATGILSGKAVYLSQCHGWIYQESLGRFATQRGNIHETVEDLHNPEGMNQYLTAYLENAGAAVFTVKERDLQTATAIADNDGSGYSESGTGFETYLDGFGNASTYAYGTDPFDSGTTRRFPATGGGVATWTPSVPVDGYYNVYVSWDSDPANASDAHYRIVHPGGVIDRYYDQKVHGSTWQYTDQLWLPAGVGGLTVELVGDSTQTGAWLNADAVRIGGGMGVITRQGVTTGRPRWEGGAVQGVQFLGAPSSIYDPFSDGDGSDPTSRSRWAAWEHPSGEEAVYVSWHSNALTGQPDSPARGTTVYYAGGGSDSPHAAECSAGAVTGSFTLADELQDGIMEQIVGRWDAGWQDRGVNRECFSEVSPSNNSEMPAALIELAFHDNPDDAAALKDPGFRRDVSRGMAKGIIRYFAAQDGVTPQFPPESPQSVSALHEPGGGIRLSWAAGPSGGLDGDAPTGYIVYTSVDGRSWDNGFAVSGTTTLVNPPYATRFWRVVATNGGGQSFPSDIVGARHSPEGFAPILVVGAFDRFDTGQLGFESINTLGTVRRFDVRAVNASDIVVPLGRSVGDAGWFFDSIADEALPSVDLSAYDLVVWGAGEESTVDETFSDAQQATIRAFVDGGGALIASGSEVLWDLDNRGSTTDRAFASDVLGATFAADAAASTVVVGEGVLAGLNVDYGNGRYPAEFADVLTPGSPVIARYNGGEVAGVLGGGVAFFGFPLDVIGDEAQRTAVFDALLTELIPDVEPPPVVDPDPPPIDTDEPPPDTDVPPGDTDGPVVQNARRVPLGELGRGCGCASGSPVSTGLFTLMLAFLARRRSAR
ncbi:MAG: N-acetylmuramoyl-L-alanine amidase [Myxococcota bacterium]